MENYLRAAFMTFRIIVALIILMLILIFINA